jgi:ribosomal protein S18 acetylase RimI-like enzyme
MERIPHGDPVPRLNWNWLSCITESKGLPMRTGVANKIIIRPGRENEISAVLRLWREAGVTPPSASDSIEGLGRLMHEPAALLLVATIDDRIIGSVIGGWDGWRGNIYRLAVAPGYRREGVARRLIEEITTALFAKGALRLSALVEHEHSWAISFWESVRELGYEPDPKFVRYIADRQDQKDRVS